MSRNAVNKDAFSTLIARIEESRQRGKCYYFINGDTTSYEVVNELSKRYFLLRGENSLTISEQGVWLWGYTVVFTRTNIGIYNSL